jgi:hypothetical protein
VEDGNSLELNKTHAGMKFSEFVRICHDFLFYDVTNNNKFCCCLFAFVVFNKLFK